MSETKYLVVCAEGDVDEDEGLTAVEVAQVMAPGMALDAARFRMMVRLTESLGDGDPAGIMEDAADQIARDLEDKHGKEYACKHPGLMLAEMMDVMLARFPETK